MTLEEQVKALVDQVSLLLQVVGTDVQSAKDVLAQHEARIKALEAHFPGG